MQRITVANIRATDAGHYVGRPSALGNPFPVDRQTPRHVAIERYETWLRGRIVARDALVLAELAKLFDAAVRGPVTLLCWCHPKPCHADIVKKVLDESFVLCNIPVDI